MTTDNTKPAKRLSYQDRLDAKKAKLEAEARESQMRLQNNLAYTGKNIPAIAVQEVTDKVKEKSPAAAKLFRAFGVGEPKKGTRILSASRTGARFYDDTGDFNTDADVAIGLPAGRGNKGKALLGILEEYGLPLLATFGSRKLLSMTLGGSGKLLRSGLSLLFRRKR